MAAHQAAVETFLAEVADEVETLSAFQAEALTRQGVS
jgi:hypothetical protein